VNRYLGGIGAVRENWEVKKKSEVKENSVNADVQTMTAKRIQTKKVDAEPR